MRRAGDWRCPFTGRWADELHHPTGRGPDGDYLDPGFVVPLGRRAHVVEHQCWEVARLDDGSEADPDGLRLGRVGRLLVRLAEAHPDGVVVLPAAVLWHLGVVLLRVADRLLR